MIKFRAWGRNGNHPGTPSEKFEMFYDVSVVTTYDDKEQHVIADFGMWNESEYNGTEIIDYTLMQSTGLFDKNGVEVFEGDIVEIIYDYEPFIGVVVYDLGETDFKATNGNEDYGNNFQYLTVGESIEVIGNVHQHPDLLESVGKRD